jgi:hypothetical protein
MVCPSCGQLAGRPTRMTREAESLALELICVSCAYHWTMSAPAPRPVLKASRDRRRSVRNLLNKTA